MSSPKMMSERNLLHSLVSHVTAYAKFHNNISSCTKSLIKLLKPTGYVKHQQFNIQQLYALPTLYLCVLYLSQNKE
jgi:hypothetical protein